MRMHVDPTRRNHQPGGVDVAPSRPLLAADGGDPTFDQNRRAGFLTRPAGNAVNLEDEMLKTSANQMDYAAMTSLYSKSLHLLKTAIGKG